MHLNIKVSTEKWLRFGTSLSVYIGHQRNGDDHSTVSSVNQMICNKYVGNCPKFTPIVVISLILIVLGGGERWEGEVNVI